MATKVLALHSEPAAALALRLILEHAGHDVVVSLDGQAGPRLAREQRPDLVIVDSALLGAQGRAQLDRIRDRADVPLLLLTPQPLAEGGREGADGQLAKPFTSDELLAEVDALARHATGGQARA